MHSESVAQEAAWPWRHTLSGPRQWGRPVDIEPRRRGLIVVVVLRVHVLGEVQSRPAPGRRRRQRDGVSAHDRDEGGDCD